MPSTSMRRPGQNRAMRSVTRPPASPGPAVPATWVAIWRLLHSTDLITLASILISIFLGKDLPRSAWQAPRPGPGPSADRLGEQPGRRYQLGLTRKRETEEERRRR